MVCLGWDATEGHLRAVAGQLAPASQEHHGRVGSRTCKGLTMAGTKFLLEPLVVLLKENRGMMGGADSGC
jgi:hypothetical protein